MYSFPPLVNGHSSMSPFKVIFLMIGIGLLLDLISPSAALDCFDCGHHIGRDCPNTAAALEAETVKLSEACDESVTTCVSAVEYNYHTKKPLHKKHCGEKNYIIPDDKSYFCPPEDIEGKTFKRCLCSRISLCNNDFPKLGSSDTGGAPLVRLHWLLIIASVLITVVYLYNY